MKRINEVSKESGISIDTLRYYERIGLITDIARNKSGHRCYDDDDIGWINLLICLRGTGMSIADMQRFAQLVRGTDATIPARIALLQQHRADVEAHIALLVNQLDAIDVKLGHYLEHMEQEHEANIGAIGD
ncbi:MAG: MerR family transcriptional regulator [Chloroflexota bacterium]